MRCRHELQLMSDAASAIAALMLGPQYARRADIEKQKRILPVGPETENRHIDLPTPPWLSFENAKKRPFCVHNFFASGLFALPFR